MGSPIFSSYINPNGRFRLDMTLFVMKRDSGTVDGEIGGQRQGAQYTAMRVYAAPHRRWHPVLDGYRWRLFV
jgi:hypothetical protein